VAEKPLEGNFEIFDDEEIGKTYLAQRRKVAKVRKTRSTKSENKNSKRIQNDEKSKF
jgi:hypothetical protein